MGNVKWDPEHNKEDYMLDWRLIKNAIEIENSSMFLEDLFYRFSIFMFSMLPIVIIILIWGVVGNGGREWTIIMTIIYTIIFLMVKFRANKYEAYLFLVLKASDYVGQLDAYKNTIKESSYLIPKLKKIEKEKDIEKRKRLYYLLVRQMDKRYGKGKHLVGRPYENEYKKDAICHSDESKKNDISKNMSNKLSKQLVKKNLPIYLKVIFRDFNSFMKQVEQKGSCTIKMIEKLDENLDWQKKWRHELPELYGYKPSINDKRYWSAKGALSSLLGEVNNKYDIGLVSLLSIRSHRMFWEDIDPNEYYYMHSTETMVEGKLIYELIQYMNSLLEYKIDFDWISKSEYYEICYQLEQKGFDEAYKCKCYLMKQQRDMYLDVSGKRKRNWTFNKGV